MASAARLVSMIFSSPSIRLRRALMLSETALSALGRLLTRALRRAACTGGVGVGLLGSLSLSYSVSAVGTALVVVAAALDTAIWRETRGWISGGAEGPGELPKREPPRRGFLFEERDLSSSKVCVNGRKGLRRISRTIYAGFYSFLYIWFKDESLSPYLNNTPKFVFDLICSSFVCYSGGFGDDGRKCDKELILLSSFRLLGDFIGKVDQIEPLIRARVLETLQP